MNGILNCSRRPKRARIALFAVARQWSAICLAMALTAGWGSAVKAQSLQEPVSAKAGAAIANCASSAGDSHTLPAGTELYFRLRTAVSTTSSHLHQSIQAEVVRQVDCDSSVVIPLNAVAQGTIEKLIPSSNPTDRAKLLLRFTRLNFPQGESAPIEARVIAVENAREKVLADGSIQGLLASEVPLSLLQSALGKLGAAVGGSGGTLGQQEKKYFGKPDTSIAYPIGTDVDVKLNQPLAVTGLFTSPFSSQLSSPASAAVARLLAQAPQRVSSKDGKPGDPLNLLIIGTEDEIKAVFQKAGWSAPEASSASSIWQAVQAAIKNQGYGAAPLSTLYLFGRPEDLAFEKMLNTFEKRHHLRLWRSSMTTPDGRPIWLGASTHDNGIDIHPGVVSHAIDPNLDDERAKVAADLGLTGLVTAEQLVSRPNPLTGGLTATGAPWKTDGRLLALDLKRE